MVNPSRISRRVAIGEPLLFLSIAQVPGRLLLAVDAVHRLRCCTTVPARPPLVAHYFPGHSTAATAMTDARPARTTGEAQPITTSQGHQSTPKGFQTAQKSTLSNSSTARPSSTAAQPRAPRRPSD